MSRLIALYPRSWRDRYEDEMRSLLEARPPTIRDRLDLVRGAVDARVHPQGPAAERISDRAGYISLAAFGLFTVTILVAINGPLIADEYGTYRDGGAAVPIAFLAMMAMAIAIYRLASHLPAEAEGTRLAGAIAAVSGLLYALGPWMMVILVIFLLATLVVILGAQRAGLWPRWLTIALILTFSAPFVLLVATVVLPWYELRQSQFPILVVFTPLFVLPVVVGISLLRGFPRRIEA
jgi:hypothetical protein